MALTITFEFDKEQQNYLNNIIEIFDDVTEEIVWGLKAVRKSVMDNFDFERDPEGKPWKPLSKETVLRRSNVPTNPDIQENFEGLHILIDHGFLRNSIDASTENNIRERGKNRAAFGSAVEYAIFHQTGVPERNIPRRAFMPEGEVLKGIFWPEFLDLLEQKLEDIG